MFIIRKKLEKILEKIIDERIERFISKCDLYLDKEEAKEN